MSKPNTPRETNPAILRDATLARLPHRSSASGQIRWPAIPSLLDHYALMLSNIFSGLGRALRPQEEVLLRENLSRELKRAFEASPYSKVVIDYHTDAPPSTALTYNISCQVITLSDEYDEWVETRQPPLFGAHADAKVLSLAHTLGAPHEVAVLDVGAGTGRNTLPLAREGFHVDAIEVAPSLAAVLRADLEKTGLKSTVFEGDALDPALGVPEGRYQLVVLAEVVASHFRDTDQLRRLFERAEKWLAPGGMLLFSAFLAADEYEPDTLARQASQVFWCCLFTRKQVEEAGRGLALMRVSDESTYAFERVHLPDEAWPPTGWFEQWSRGCDLFQLPPGRAPHELRWLVYRKTAEPQPPHERWFETSVSMLIPCPRERAFQLLVSDADLPRIFRSFPPVPGIARSELLDGPQPLPGGRRRITWTDDSVTTEEILEFEPALRYRYRWSNTLKGPLALLVKVAESELHFASTPTGTTIYWSYRFEPRALLVQRLMNIVLAGFRRWMRRSLQALKDLVEAG